MEKTSRASAWDKWIVISMKAAGLLLVIMLFVFYFTFFLPVAVIFRIVSDPLRLKRNQPRPGTFFEPRKRVTETAETAVLPY
jgi:hypothetical protein